MTTLSPLDGQHRALGATMTDFAGWSMPVRYGSELAEHRATRDAAGIFDVSHMGEISVTGLGAADALDFAVVSRVSAMEIGRAKYTMLCASDGGVLDDLIVYRRAQHEFLVVANAANTAVVTAELVARAAGFDCHVADRSQAMSLIALQGPVAMAIVTSMCADGGAAIEQLKYYAGADTTLLGGIHAFVGRTGYTGEDGFELFVAAADAVAVWALALAIGEPAGLMPCGLAARDSLRLEAGMPLYGNELSAQRQPAAAGLGRVVTWGSAQLPRGDFVGRAALEAPRGAGLPEVLVGLAGTGKRAARAGSAVLDADGVAVGTVTSGALSPTLGHPVAMAYVATAESAVGTALTADVRGRLEPMTVVALPFYQRTR